MTKALNLSACKAVNYLWSNLLESLGLEKASQVIRQAIDLQNMQGKEGTLPVLFVKTGGVALTSFDSLQIQTGLKLNGPNKVLLYCPKEKSFQVLHEVKNNKTILGK